MELECILSVTGSPPLITDPSGNVVNVPGSSSSPTQALQDSNNKGLAGVPQGGDSTVSVGVLVGAILGGAVVVAFLVGLFIFIHKRGDRSEPEREIPHPSQQGPAMIRPDPPTTDSNDATIEAVPLAMDDVVPSVPLVVANVANHQRPQNLPSYKDQVASDRPALPQARPIPTAGGRRKPEPT